jgi:hypothetical protein
VAGNPLRHVGDEQEIIIGFQRPDGSWGSTPVWDVRVGDDIFVRSMTGARGGWYRRLLDNPDGEVRDGEHVHRVHAEAVSDSKTVAAVTEAYATKYAGSPYLPPLVDRESANSTLRLTPR